MSQVLKLSSVLDIVAAPGLLDNFLQMRGNQILVDASAVQRLGAQCLQILLAARIAWEEDNVSLEFQDPSEDFVDSLELFGTSLDKLTYHAQHNIGENNK